MVTFFERRSALIEAELDVGDERKGDGRRRRLNLMVPTVAAVAAVRGWRHVGACTAAGKGLLLMCGRV